MSITGEQILDIRNELGMTQYDFAAKLMISRNYVSLLETGAKEASPRLEKRILALLSDSNFQKWSDATSTNSKLLVSEDSQQSYDASDSLAQLREIRRRDAVRLTSEIRRAVDELILAARNDPDQLAWIIGEIREHLRVPNHWKYLSVDPDDHPAVKAGLAAARKRRAAFRDADEDKKDKDNGEGHSQAAS